jgi:DNA-binding beta-propeller fold protein YncE
MHPLKWESAAAFAACLGVWLFAPLALAGYWRVANVAIDAKLSEPFGVDFDESGAMYVIEYGGHRLLRVKNGHAEVVAGNGQKGFGGDGGPAAQAQLNSPHSIAIAPSGDVYIADSFNCRVRKIDAKSGIITTFAGTGQKGFSGDGAPAEKAQFGDIYCVAFDAKFERMYLADLDNRRIRMIDMKSGMVSTVAGNGKKGAPKDGEDAKEQPLVDPRAVAAADWRGNVYILERSGNALRVVDSAGKIKTVAGTGKAGYSGDKGPASKAMLNGPKHLCVFGDGALIADTENHVICQYKANDGTIELVVGTGKKGADFDQNGSRCELSRPHGVFARRNGFRDEIYIADSENNRVLRAEWIASP